MDHNPDDNGESQARPDLTSLWLSGVQLIEIGLDALAKSLWSSFGIAHDEHSRLVRVSYGSIDEEKSLELNRTLAVREGDAPPGERGDVVPMQRV